jgi:hypothetical protein
MKKYTFTLTITETATSEVVNNIIEKVAQEEKLKNEIKETNLLVVEEMKKVLNVIYSELTELLQPLNLGLSTHFRGQCGLHNSEMASLTTMIGGSKEHSVGRIGIYIQIICPRKNDRLTFNPIIKVYSQNAYGSKQKSINFTTSEDLIEVFSDELEYMYRNNK